MPRRGTLPAALAILLVTFAVFPSRSNALPPGSALPTRGLQGCWTNAGICFLPDCLFPGTLYKNVCNGASYCVCSSGGFTPTASVGPGGRVQIGGHAACFEGAVADLRVTITQRGTGAVAEGRTRITCTGDETSWEIQGETVGRRAFVAGPATACGLLEVTGVNDPPDAVQWCRDGIELTP